MIQNRLKDKDKDIQGLKKQTSSLLNCAWEKGYVAGFDDGYKNRPKGKWLLLDKCSNEGVYCSNCLKKVYRKEYANQKVKSNFCPNCGADMRGKENG